MHAKIRKTGDFEEKLNILVYGQAGTGKTSLLGTGEPRFKTLIGSAESGLLSLKRREAELSKLLGRSFQFDVWDIKKIEDLVEMRDFLYNAKHEYKLVGLDSGTELQKVLTDAILTQKKRDEMQQKDWGTLLNKMVGIIRSFRDLPHVSFLLTALSEEQKNEQELSHDLGFSCCCKSCVNKPAWVVQGE